MTHETDSAMKSSGCSEPHASPTTLAPLRSALVRVQAWSSKASPSSSSSSIHVRSIWARVSLALAVLDLFPVVAEEPLLTSSSRYFIKIRIRNIAYWACVKIVAIILW